MAKTPVAHSKAQNPAENEPKPEPNPNPNPGPNPAQPNPPPPDPTKPVDPSQPAAVKTTKSIVPSKYTARYKNGGDDVLANFIKSECASQEGFNFDKFFELCSKTGIAQDKVDHYKGQVSAKRHGAEGRARMTLRNMLATIVRKNGKALSLAGHEVPLSMPKPALTGAAKAASERVPTDEAKEPA